MGNQEKINDDEVINLSDSDSDNNDREDIGAGEATKCQVCGMAANSRHFGGLALACRACSAFFRCFLMD
jgi:hypothetical protein